MTSKEAELAWTVWQAAYHTAIHDVDAAAVRLAAQEARTEP